MVWCFRGVDQIISDLKEFKFNPTFHKLNLNRAIRPSKGEINRLIRLVLLQLVGKKRKIHFFQFSRIFFQNVHLFRSSQSRKLFIKLIWQWIWSSFEFVGWVGFVESFLTCLVHLIQLFIAKLGKKQSSITIMINYTKIQTIHTNFMQVRKTWMVNDRKRHGYQWNCIRLFVTSRKRCAIKNGLFCNCKHRIHASPGHMTVNLVKEETRWRHVEELNDFRLSDAWDIEVNCSNYKWWHSCS